MEDPLGASPALLHRGIRVSLGFDGGRATPDDAGGTPAGGDIFHFGIGVGDYAAHALKTRVDVRVMAWDRDPWMLRTALTRHDFAAEIFSGRFVLGMVGDLFQMAPALVGPGGPVFFHPGLDRVYSIEKRYLRAPPGEKRAVICDGGLFVDDLAEALADEGFSLFTLDVEGVSDEEMSRFTGAFQPQVFAAVNHRNGLAEFCHWHGCRLLVWEIDPSRDDPAPCRTPSWHAAVFTYRKAHVAAFKAAGFDNAEYLPLAASPSRRRPEWIAGCAGDGCRGNRVSFVGSSMRGEAEKCLADLSDMWDRFSAAPPAPTDTVSGCPTGGGGSGKSQFALALDEAFCTQRENWFDFTLPEGMEERMPGFLAWAASRVYADPAGLSVDETGRRACDPVRLAAEIAAMEKRRSVVSSLAKFGVEVWGDTGWDGLDGLRYMGPAEHFAGLNRIYSTSAVNLDVGRLYQSDIVTMRVFDALACGGFVLAECSPALRELFRPGVELDTYGSIEELVDKTAYYLNRPEVARRMAEKGREKVLKHHTVARRVRRMLRVLFQDTGLPRRENVGLADPGRVGGHP